ncbi:MAG: iron ABC transporter permease [Anaerolineaceae bacterium]|nr:iron ABC transporter permease [Anaerolineaceae bacterium]
MNLKAGHASHPYVFSSLLLAAVLVLSIAVGSVFIPPAQILQVISRRLQGLPPDSALLPFDTILFSLRLPRTAMTALVGAALACSGGAYQGLFRNPLADPYLIGVASGAGLGAVAALTLHWPRALLGLLAIPLSAFAGALLTVLLVYNFSKIGRTVPTTTLILAGVAISAFASALTSFLMLRAGNEIRRAIYWLLGGALMSGWQPVLAALPYILGGCGVLLLMGHALNVLQFGDEQAQQLGLPAVWVRRIVIVAASLATAAAVSFVGIIGFVGLVIPHIVRLIWGGDYRRLLWLAFLNGATFLLAADILARSLFAPEELPVGIITALTGAPFFLWVLRRAKDQTIW